MDELRPRIKPKAPASLKENVLQAVREEPHRASSWRKATWWVAAAVFLGGILTFCLWPVNEKQPQQQAKVQTNSVQENPTPLHPQQKDEVYLVAVTNPPSQKNMTEVSRRFHPSAQPPTSPSEEPPFALPAIVNEDVDVVEPIEEETPLTPNEQQLLANIEAHRDLVNACLAEELAQVRSHQYRIAQLNQQYMQEYLDLQQRISQQIRDGIDSIGSHSNNPKEV